MGKCVKKKRDEMNFIVSGYGSPPNPGWIWGGKDLIVFIGGEEEVREEERGRGRRREKRREREKR